MEFACTVVDAARLKAIAAIAPITVACLFLCILDLLSPFSLGHAPLTLRDPSR